MHRMGEKMALNNAGVAELTAKHVMTTYSRLPIALVRGEGVRVWDADGRSYLDFISGLGVNSLGHNHPRVTAAIHEAAGTLVHCSNLYHIESQARLAARLAELTGLDRAFFCNSGAEANEAAIKLARRYARVRRGEDRFEIITAERSFHGRTLATVTATGQPKYQQGFEPLPQGFRYVPLNDIDALERAITPQTCAVLLEPIQGEGGVFPCDEAYLRQVRELCDAHGLLLIFDEVQTGLGRTGRMFAFEHYGVRPDIITLAKALGGGVPIGAIVATEEASKGFEPGSHASTFGGNPLSTYVACEVLDILIDESLPERAEAAGNRLRQGLLRLQERYPDALGEVRGRGLMLGMELHFDGSALLAATRERGLLVNVIAGKVLRLLPPLIVADEEIDLALEILAAAIEESIESSTVRRA